MKYRFRYRIVIAFTECKGANSDCVPGLGTPA